MAPEVIAKGFGVYDEWGPLKEVFVGSVDGTIIPIWHSTLEFLTDETVRRRFKEKGNRSLKEGWPELYDGLKSDLDGLATAYEANGVQVHRPRPLTPAEVESVPRLPGGGGAWPAFPADCVWVIGSNFVECSMRIVALRKNRFWVREVVLPRMQAIPQARWLACPEPLPADDFQGPGPFLDGGDIVLVGNARDILCGVDHASTSELGYRWLAQALKPDGYKVWPMTFNMIEVHLLAHLNLVRQGLGLICREAFRGHQIPDIIKDWEFIEITPEEVHKGGADVVMINPQRVLVAEAQPRVADELAKRGIEPVLVPIPNAARCGAGIRCCTIIVHREKATT